MNGLSRLEEAQRRGAAGNLPRQHRGVERAVQLQLMLTYRELLVTGRPLPSLADAELRFYSQTGEDGIILVLLAATGMKTRRVVEVCAGNGIECNAANLIVNHGFAGLLVDRGEDLLTQGGPFYEDGADTWYWPPVLLRAWVTRNNVNQLITDAGSAGDIDLLSIDLDGMDYWVWEAIDCVRSRVVVIEYNAVWGPDEPMTVPYSEDFQWVKGTQYLGASLAAMVKLGERKGYRFVGTNSYGFNAFFVRDDLARDSLPAADPRDSFRHPAPGHSTTGLELVRNEPWVRV